MRSAEVIAEHEHRGRRLAADGDKSFVPDQGTGRLRADGRGPECLSSPDAYLDLLRRDDCGAALLRIMRGIKRTRHKRETCVAVLPGES